MAWKRFHSLPLSEDLGASLRTPAMLWSSSQVSMGGTPSSGGLCHTRRYCWMRALKELVLESTHAANSASTFSTSARNAAPTASPPLPLLVPLSPVAVLSMLRVCRRAPTDSAPSSSSSSSSESSPLSLLPTANTAASSLSLLSHAPARTEPALHESSSSVLTMAMGGVDVAPTAFSFPTRTRVVCKVTIRHSSRAPAWGLKRKIGCRPNACAMK
mmetsp:Transcript_14389/g.40725  ORF Transcript_14389/g.40725 Transcript_14389/m.40725 type:complete len:215 (-) Transcript_14389:70-714(-)